MAEPDNTPVRDEFRVEDRLRIAEVLRRYCRAIDRIDMPLLATVFAGDAIIDKGDGLVAVADFISEVGTRHPSVPRTSHMVMNELIDFTGPDSAFVESWCLAVEQRPVGDGTSPDIDHVFRVRYGDEFQRLRGEWKIGRRMYVIDHVMSAPVAHDLLPDNGGRYEGVRGPEDPISRARNAFIARD